MEEDSAKLMEEMNRFEAEIADSPPDEDSKSSRPVIGANTFQTVQQKLESAPPPPRPAVLPPKQTLVPIQFPSPAASQAIGGYQAVFSNLPPPPPPPSFLVPNQVRSKKGMDDRSDSPPLRSGPVILAAGPTKYKPQPNYAYYNNMDEELNEFFTEIRKEEEKVYLSVKSAAKMMADRVRANTTVSVQPSSSSSTHIHVFKQKKEKKSQNNSNNNNKKLVRSAGGQVWEDQSLQEWEDDDFRIFCGDLGNDVTDDVLVRAFNKYPSFLKAKVVRDKRTNKTKGFGFVSFKDPQDFIKAMKEMNGRYVGSRPIKLRKSCWKQRSLDVVKKKEKEKAALINLLTGK